MGMPGPIVTPEQKVAYRPSDGLAAAISASYDRAAELSAPVATDFAFLAVGFGKQEIGAMRHKSRGTVKNNQAAIASRLGVPNETEILTVVAHASGWFRDYGSELAPEDYPYDAERLIEKEKRLPPRPRQVLGMKVSGATTPEIASELKLSTRTIQGCLEEIRQRLLGHPYEHHPRTIHTAIAAMWLEGLVEVSQNE